MGRVISKFLPLFGLIGAALGGGMGASAQSPAPAHPDFSGVWQVERAYALTMPTLDKKPIPFQPWAEALYKGAQQSETELHFPWPPNNQRCLVAGMVRAMKGNFPWRLVETEGQITVLFEEDGRVNIIPFADRHAANVKPSWYGDPIARWEGDTLVIDVIGFNGKTPFPRAIHHTTALHVVHRFRLLDDGKRLEDRIRIEDPGAYTRPWETISVFYKHPPEYELRDYRCAENNRDLPPAGGKMAFWGSDWGPD